MQIADWSGADCAIADWPRDDPTTMLNGGANAQGQIRWQFEELQMGKWV